MGTYDNKRSESAHRLRRGDFRTGRSDDHRVLRLRHDSALHIEEGRIRHHGAGPYEAVQESRGTRLKPMGPPLRKRQRLEFVRDELEEPVRLGLLLRFHLQYAINVAGPATVDLAGAGRRKRLDRHDLSRLEEIVAVGDVGNALAGMEQVPFNR